MEQEIDLRKIWEVIKKRWLILVAIPLSAALISGGISFYVLKPVYQSSTTLIVGKKAIDLEEQSARQLLENNVLEANRQLAKTYGEIAKSRTVREQVIIELNLGLSEDELNSNISVSQINETEILQITVSDTNPQLAADIANSVARKFEAAVMEIKKVDSVSIVDKAVAPIAPVKPDKIVNILIAFIAGFIGALGLSLLLEYLNNTISSSKEAEELLGLSVLGVILDYRYDKIRKERPCENIISEP
ncbi:MULTISPECIES: YveK family protein [unclassified Dehalobacter]|uniref:YveK family protein n=1 Tax=unclassified Dehalobacter TaxID=2635733 RepID=UPI00036CD76F|nr:MULTISPECIES: Wzz/FepE/Etk N-terminal domain-containing protein [unclassified Dehalobacter]RJE48983.1 lipopolysaccharide biosynthesis protein [Dehalobacter sp. MCB1]TCX51721.1 lipopolysaccharide biosynthesis protein [Dehalobacter sp. 14DCB1]TCX52781.1 lipopolysaccharide biosynthesis protein [Dehalobacter sp. 12DCB1]